MRRRERRRMTDLAEAAAASMDQGLQDTQRHQDNFTRFLERDVRAQRLLNSAPAELSARRRYLLRVAAYRCAGEGER